MMSLETVSCVRILALHEEGHYVTKIDGTIINAAVLKRPYKHLAYLFFMLSMTFQRLLLTRVHAGNMGFVFVIFYYSLARNTYIILLLSVHLHWAWFKIWTSLIYSY
jgi:hypothetical protein